MTYTVNGTQYWKRNGIFCSCTKEEGKKVITEELYNEMRAKYLGKPITIEKFSDNDKIVIMYQETIKKTDKIANLKKTVLYKNLNKSIDTIKSHDNFIKIVSTKKVA